MRREVARVRVDVADLGRPDDLPFGVARGDLLSLGDVARANPLPGARIAVAEGEELDAGYEQYYHAAGLSIEPTPREQALGLIEEWTRVLTDSATSPPQH